MILFKAYMRRKQFEALLGIGEVGKAFTKYSSADNKTGQPQPQPVNAPRRFKGKWRNAKMVPANAFLRVTKAQRITGNEY